jgi:2-oxoglutarate dehydrogenase E1 component
LDVALPEDVAELDPGLYGLIEADAAPFRATYCGTLGWEFGHVQDRARYAWLAWQAEAPHRRSGDERRAALDLIARAELFERTLDRRLPGAKTFGLSGAESFLVLLRRVMARGVHGGARKIVVGGMHRGRLTQMALVFGKPLPQVVAEAQGLPSVPEGSGSSDSPYHLGWQDTVEIEGRQVRIWVAPHPSHLSIVGPVALGRARALGDRGQTVLPLVLHTDAAFAGQGVNAEMMQLSGLAPFEVGGAIHLVLNNQLGFTTGVDEARTARTCADIAKLVEAPILHVNGDDPDAAMRAAEVAVAYRARFGADIVVDLIACRRKGHNEIDQPRFTQPGMYRRIDALAPLSAGYGARIGAEPAPDAFRAELDAAFEAAKGWRPNLRRMPEGVAHDIVERLLEPVDTGVSEERLRELGRRITALPAGIEPHPKVADFLADRRADIEAGENIDWATAEALALASLLDEGVPVRLGGQDSVRGAFTQRHLTVHCQRTGRRHSVLSDLGVATIFNTPLTENAVLGFEYGYSLGEPDGLTVWEAQFGDFINVAQPVFDQFVICGEDRWHFESSLVLLLPHGLDGGGPDHATAHPERMLAACANGNMRLVNLSTPANYFHALRRQVLSPLPKPLVVLAPKALLRHPRCVSPLAELADSFRPVIAEDRPARRVVLSTGKLAVLLEAAREQGGHHDVALIRLEQLYPLDEAALARALAPHADAELVWAQEEPENMGYFCWLDRRLEAIAGRRWRLVTRPASPSAASGPKKWDDAHLKAVIVAALEGE